MKKTLLVLFLLLAGTDCRAEALVSLRRAADVQGPSIRLSDVFEGVPAAMDRDVALAPEPGRSVTYNAQVLTRLAEQNHLIWRAQSATDSAVLTRASTLITPEMLKEKIAAKIKEDDPGLQGALEIVLEGKNVGLFLPAQEKPEFALEAFQYTPQSRRFQTEVVAGAARQNLTGRVIVRREVPVLARPLERRSVVGEGDLTWRTMEEDRLPQGVLTDASQIVGREMKTDQSAGEMLRARDLLPPRLVTRGSLVTIKIETPLMRITAQGKSLADGAKGDTVRVTNVQSKRVIEGVVEADGVVRVETAPRKIAAAPALEEGRTP